MSADLDDRVEAWIEAEWSEYAGQLTPSDLRRGIQGLSGLYVHDRSKGQISARAGQHAENGHVHAQTCGANRRKRKTHAKQHTPHIRAKQRMPHVHARCVFNGKTNNIRKATHATHTCA